MSKGCYESSSTEVNNVCYLMPTHESLELNKMYECPWTGGTCPIECDMSLSLSALEPAYSKVLLPPADGRSAVASCDDY